MVQRVVIDTCVFVSALRSSRGASYRMLSLVGTGAFDIALSVPLVLEYEDAAKRLRQGGRRVADGRARLYRPAASRRV